MFLAGAAITCGGCASGSPQMGAKSFYEEHAQAATRIAAATKTVELGVSRLPASPARTQLSTLAVEALRARTRLTEVGRWTVRGEGEEGAEEEDIPRAETQVAEGAEALAAAMSSLASYTSMPEKVVLARYQNRLSSGRTSWNEGISQLWYLAHESKSPRL